jgi:hypothetical protein
VINTTHPYPCRPTHICPHWLFFSRLGPPVAWSNLFRNCIPIPGMKHICDNLVNDMTKALAHYTEFFKQCSWFDLLLGKPFYRDRLASTCLKGNDKVQAADPSIVATCHLNTPCGDFLRLPHHMSMCTSCLHSHYERRSKASQFNV